MIKFIINIFTLLLFALVIPTIAHDYYAIPSGWEKVCEFNSSYELQLKTSKNQLYFHQLGQYSQDGGKTFREIKIYPNSAQSSISFVKGNLNIYFYSFGWGGTYSIDLQNYQNSIINYKLINSNFDLLPNGFKCNSLNYETMLVKIKDVGRLDQDTDILFISKDFGNTWKRIANISKYESTNYIILFDMNNPQKWFIKAYCTFVLAVCEEINFSTDDNGITFTEIQIDDFAPSNEKDFTNFDEIFNGNRYYFTRKNNYYGYGDSLNYLVISNIFNKNMKTVLSLDSVVADYSKLSNVPENSVNFSNIFFYTNDKGMLFQTRAKQNIKIKIQLLLS